MAYTKQNFEDGQVLKAEHLNKMEEGIEDVSKIVLREKSDTLTWDGNIDGLVSVSGVIFKVSDATPALSDFSNGGYGYVNGEFSEFSADDIIEDQGAITIGTIAFIIHAEEVGVEIGGIVFPEPGTYFSYIPDRMVISSLTIPGYTGFVTEKLDPAYLPDVSDIPVSWIAALQTAMGIS